MERDPIIDDRSDSGEAVKGEGVFWVDNGEVDVVKFDTGEVWESLGEVSGEEGEVAMGLSLMLPYCQRLDEIGHVRTPFELLPECSYPIHV